MHTGNFQKNQMKKVQEIAHSEASCLSKRLTQLILIKSSLQKRLLRDFVTGAMSFGSISAEIS